MSVTTVPIPPVQKGSLVKLWAGVGLAVLVAAGGAWLGTAKAVTGGCGPNAFAPAKGSVLSADTTATGLKIQTVKGGNGPSPTDADVVLVNYTGALTDGKQFDSGQRTPFQVQGLVPGFSEALKLMQRGGSYKICIPPALGYGAQANERIPANSTLLFDVDLLDFKSMAEVQAMQQQVQQQGGAGAPQSPGLPQ
jgi:FKBP-type peptidyl-prolyl cis-trans isomerase FkpA